MNFLIFSTFTAIALLAVCASLPSEAVEGPAKAKVKILKYKSSVKEIVKDLITNWNSPIRYLRNRGYLTAPQIEFDMFRKDIGKEESKSQGDAKIYKRMSGSNEYEGSSDLGNMFRSLFASNDNSGISDKIKLKLGVGWDMDKLKTSVRNEAHKFYEKFYNKRNQQVPNEQLPELSADIDKQVAQLYPSVLPNPTNDHTETDEKKESLVPAAHKETKFLNGIAKLLTNRVKPLPLQVQESKKAVESPSLQ